MAYLATQKPKGKDPHYRLYKGAKKPTKTKSRLLKEALGKAVIDDEHAKTIDFIPAKFTLQVHGWVSKDSKIKKLSDVEAIIKKALKDNKDPVKEVDKAGAKAHYDLRIQKSSAPCWWGLTPFRAPWTGTADNKVLGTVKGYQSIIPGGKRLQKFLSEKADRELAKEGIAERRDRIEWMKVKSQWFPPGSPGNPTKQLPAFMIAIEFFKPCTIHRRELYFFDVTFFGDYLKGRYYNRLVERKMNVDEMSEWQKKLISKGKIKDFYNLNFYFWKAKDQWGDPKSKYSMKDVYQAALGKKTLTPLLAPKKV